MQVLSLLTANGPLLIPVGMVAQIVSHGEHSAFTHQLSFVRHSIQWRELNIPLVFSSEMLGSNPDTDDSYIRSVILWPMKGTKNNDLFALTSLDSPKVLIVEDKDIALESEKKLNNENLLEVESDEEDIEFDHDEPANAYTLGVIRLGEVAGYIPNLKTLSEKLFLELNATE